VKAFYKFQVALCKGLQNMIRTLEPAALRRLSDRELAVILREARVVLDELQILEVIIQNLPWPIRLWLWLKGSKSI
jgi:hypothetical protein